MLPERRCGEAEVRHILVSVEEAEALSLSKNEFWTPGRFCQLEIGGRVWMYDMLDERVKNERIVREARGDVLITGLGLGMILHPILKKPEVHSVQVLENNPDVITLVLPSLMRVPGREKLRVELADADAWTPGPDTCFDTIWLDHVAYYAVEPGFVASAEERVCRYQTFLRDNTSYIGHWALEEVKEALADGRPTTGGEV